MNSSSTIRLVLIMLSGLALLSGGMVHSLLGGGIWGWVILGAFTLAASIGAAFLIEGMTVRPIKHLKATLEQTYADGDLSRRADISSGGDIGETAAAFNRLMESFHIIIGKVFFNAHEISGATQRVIADAQGVSKSSSEQHRAATDVADEAQHLTERLNSVRDKAGESAEISEASADLSQDGMALVDLASAEMDKIARSVHESADVISALGEQSKAISSILQTIREIADQTNLLALNAAIEAARAGESGRGFAVVADEVRKLAERTATATREIGGMITNIQRETDSAVSSISAGTAQARKGAELSQQASHSLVSINTGALRTKERVDEIAQAIREQSHAGETIASHVQSIMSMSGDNIATAEQTLKAAQQLANLSTNLQEIGNVFKLGDAGKRAQELHARMPGIVAAAALEVGRLLESAINNGRLKAEDLFAEDYRPFGNTRPQKFHTRYDEITDQILPSLQEGLLNQNNWLVYAIACDRKGYVPTHNKKFSLPLTGDDKKDLTGNRTKRHFDDPVGRRCGAHQEIFLLQTYRRDTGEIMHDISAPVLVQGRHWGGFRIGYKA